MSDKVQAVAQAVESIAALIPFGPLALVAVRAAAAIVEARAQAQPNVVPIAPTVEEVLSEQEVAAVVAKLDAAAKPWQRLSDATAPPL